MSESTKGHLDKVVKTTPFNLMAHLGIDASQVEENTSTPRASKEILDNKDSLQDDAKTSIKSIMFTCFYLPLFTNFKESI